MEEIKQNHSWKKSFSIKAKEGILSSAFLFPSALLGSHCGKRSTAGHCLGHLDGVHNKVYDPCGFAWLPGLLGPLGGKRREGQHRSEKKR